MVDAERYSRQILFAPIGPEGQEKLGRSRVVLVGCGALGSAQAEMLARAGVGFLRLLDRDCVEPSNLQRQSLYDESDARAGLPKAQAARNRLRRINRAIAIEARTDDLTPLNADRLLGGCDLILDGTDNFETRFLINDYAVSSGTPWIYGAAVAARGMTFTILPGETACLACLFPESVPVAADAAELSETCDTSGVLGCAVNWVAAMQVSEAVKLLIGARSALRGSLAHVDLWTNQDGELHRPARDPQCRACAARDFAHLRGAARGALTLCGRNAVQVAPLQINAGQRRVELAALAARLRPHGEVRGNPFALRFAPAFPPGGAEIQMTIFPDGRALIHGTSDTALARSLYARFVGA